MLRVWDAKSTNVICTQPLSGTSTISVASCPSPGMRLVAVGDAQNNAEVFRVYDESKETKMSSVVSFSSETPGFISSMSFFNNENLLTVSGDRSIRIWNVPEKGIVRNIPDAHNSCILAVDVVKDIASTGDEDGVAKIWDLRQGSGKSSMTITAHNDPINSIKWFPNEQVFATGSDDSTCKLFDCRTGTQIMEYASTHASGAANSLDFSHSGKCLFVAYDYCKVGIYDTLFGNEMQVLEGHSARVGSVAVSPDGTAVMTTGWDTSIKIWA